MMMNPTYGNAGNLALPSPTIWSRCSASELNDGCGGVYFFDTFMSAVADTIASGEQRPTYGPLSIDCDDDTVVSLKASEVAGYLDVETDGDDNDAFAFFTEPFCYMRKNSLREIWLEARIEIGDADGDQGFFFGLGEEACQTMDVVADDCAALIGETLIGFRILTGENAIDFVAKKDDGSEVVILSDVTNQTVLGDNKGVLADDTEYKLGIWYDGRKTVRIYVQGVEVARWDLDSDYYDPTKALCAVYGLKTGAAAAESAAMDWIRGAYLFAGGTA